MSRIHPTAVIHPRAELADDAVIGPFCVIGDRVTVGGGTIVESHTVICGPTRIGARCRIGPMAALGGDGQFRGAVPESSWLIVGDETIVREGVSLHRSIKEGEATRIGNRCYIMATAHVGHDCQVGDDVTLANAVLLAGHVSVGDRAFIGGLSGIHQFCRIGRLAIVGGFEVARKDVPPFAAYVHGGLKAYNAIGCRRAGMDAKAIRAVRAAYQQIHSHRSARGAADAIEASDSSGVAEVREIVDFLRSGKRGITASCRFARRADSSHAGEATD